MSRPSRIIFITGFMGAGKTTVAAALAQRLDCRAIDLDRLIAEREGRTAQTIIEEEGEARFREIETRALREALENGAGCVIALGGGTWTLEQNRSLITEHQGYTVWLDAPFELCWRRIKSEGNVRPLARDPQMARHLYDERRAIYRLAALRVQASETRSADDMASEIACEVLRREGKL